MTQITRMKTKDIGEVDFSERCFICRCSRGNHQAKELHCPLPGGNRSSKQYHKTNVFTHRTVTTKPVTEENLWEPTFEI